MLECSQLIHCNDSLRIVTVAASVGVIGTSTVAVLYCSDTYQPLAYMGSVTRAVEPLGLGAP